MLLDLSIWFVLNLSGKQEMYTLKSFYDVNFIKRAYPLDIVFLNRILLVVYNKNQVILGTPIIKHLKIQTFVIQHFFGKKILIFRYKRKKNYKKLKSYKPYYTRLFFNNINYGT